MLKNKEIKPERTVITGRYYRHFKGNYYYVVGIAKSANNVGPTNELQVIYHELHKPEQLYCRNLREFTSPVERHKYPYAEQEYRMELVRFCDLPNNPLGIHTKEVHSPSVTAVLNSRDLEEAIKQILMKRGIINE